jgi:hypothetical protein
MRDSKKYPNDIVEKLAESPGMCSDGSGSAPIKIPKRETFSLRGSKKRERRRLGRVGEKRRGACLTSSRGLGPTGAWHARMVCDVPADSPRGARTVQTQGADYPLLLPERPEMHFLFMLRADGPCWPGGQSARSCRTVRPPLLISA